MQAISIAYDSDLAAYVVPAVGVAGLSVMSFLISAVRQWWLLREQEALLAEEWAAKEEEVVGDSPEVRSLFRGRVAVQGGKVRSRCRGPSAVRAYYSSFTEYMFLVRATCHGKGESCTGSHGESSECDSRARHSSHGTSTTSNSQNSESSGEARR